MTAPGMATAPSSEFDFCVRCGAPFWTRDQPGKWPCRYHPLAAVTLHDDNHRENQLAFHQCCGAQACAPQNIGRFAHGCVRADHTTAHASAGNDPCLPRAMLIDDVALDAALASGVLTGVQPAAIVRSPNSRLLAHRPNAEQLLGLAVAGLSQTPAGQALVLHYDATTAAQRRARPAVDPTSDTQASIQRKRATST